MPDRALPERPLRIVALGTSLTKTGVWPESAAERLTACLGTPVEFVRASMAGANSDWGLAQVDAVAMQAPDFVLVEFAVNDADLFDGTGLARSRQNLRGIIAALRDTRPEATVVLMSTNPVRGLRGWQRPFLRRYFDAMRVEAAAEDTGFFDGWARWQSDLRPGDLRDGLHPAPAAEDRIIAPALTAYLARSFGRDCRPPKP